MIESIDLSHSVFLTDDLVRFLVNSCPNIKRLRIWNCISLHDSGFFSFLFFNHSFYTLLTLALVHISKLHDLTYFYAGDNDNFTSRGFTVVLQNCPNLEELDISCCKKVDFYLAPAIAIYSKNLKTLRADFCPRFACDTTIITLSLMKDLPLKQIFFGDCDISNFGISELKKCAPTSKFVEIDVRRNREVGADGYDMLAEMCTDNVDGVPKSTIQIDPGRYFMRKRADGDMI